MPPAMTAQVIPMRRMLRRFINAFPLNRVVAGPQGSQRNGPALNPLGPRGRQLSGWAAASVRARSSAPGVTGFSITVARGSAGRLPLA